jgi:hypothetical protein
MPASKEERKKEEKEKTENLSRTLARAHFLYHRGAGCRGTGWDEPRGRHSTLLEAQTVITRSDRS